MLTVATYNIHKGLSPLNRKLVIHDVRTKLHALDADVVLLQEVQGAHRKHATKFEDWPEAAQHEHIAEGRYQDIIYGENARHRLGHHGNAILSAYPVLNWSNRNVSHHRFEHRGHLLAQMVVPGIDAPVTFVCIHLGLMQRSRVAQIEQLIEFLQESAPGNSPLVIAGDFNDWRGVRSGVSARLAEAIGVVEAFEHTHGKPARTFPAILPILTLDRVYVRGFEVVEARRLHGDVDGARWHGLSDHAGLVVRLRSV